MMEMIAKAAETRQMIRGKIVVGYDRCSFMSPNIEDMEAHGVSYAYAVTKWYRHDDDLSRLESDMEALSRAYRVNHNDYSGALLGIETKPYRK